MIYKDNCNISGTGNKITRENEITADNLAVLRHFIDGHDIGVIDLNNHNFNALLDNIQNNVINITDGMAIAYGYIGYCKKQILSFLLPAVEQYHLIYAEFDKSVIPNAFTIKTKNNMSNPYINVDTFRQDILSQIKTGICQVPLWQVYITNRGIKRLSDLRPLIKYIINTYHSDTAYHLNDNGTIGNNAISITQSINDVSKKIATTEFADTLIKAVINNAEFYQIDYYGTLGDGSDLAVEFNCEYSHALPGSEVTFTAICIDNNYYISKVSVNNMETDDEIVTQKIEDVIYKFIMPAADVYIIVYLQSL